MTELISREELHAAIESGTVTVVDALGGAYFEDRHLPGAIPLVEADVRTSASTLLPDKDAQIVTYCSNAACPNSQNVATLLATAGYTRVRKYRDGIQDWVEAGLPTQSGAFAHA